MTRFKLIRNQPLVLNEFQCISTACYISSVLTDVQATVLPAKLWEVCWGLQDDPMVWLSRHGVYTAHELDVPRLYAIIGYCACKDIRYFTDSMVIQLESEARHDTA